MSDGVDLSPEGRISAPKASWVDRARAMAAEHRPFVMLLGFATVLRALLVIAYRPALFFYGDSHSYLETARSFTPHFSHPIGYSAMLRAVSWTGRLIVVPMVQHVIGLAMAVLLYALLRRLGAGRGVATLAVVPVLLDVLQLSIEHHVLSEPLFQACVAIALVAVTWNARLSYRACALAGAALAAATLTRTAGLAVVPVLLGYLLVRRAGLKKIAVFGAVFAVPMLAYVMWFHSTYGRFWMEKFGGHFLYGRVAPFVECEGVSLPPEERALCPPSPRNPWPTWYVFVPDSPAATAKPPPGKDVNTFLGDFALDAIRRQWPEYGRVVARDFLHYFEPVRTTRPSDDPLAAYEFTRDKLSFASAEQVARTVRQFQSARAPGPVVVKPLASVFDRLWSFFYVPGPLYGLALALGFAGAWRRRKRIAREGPRIEGLLFATSSFVLLLLPVAAVVFDYRHMTPALPFIGVAGALGWTALQAATPDGGNMSLE